MLSEDKNSVKMEIVNPDDTVLRLLVDQLTMEDEVAEASYNIGHPDLDKPFLYVRTKKIRPQTALKKAAEALAEQYRDIKKLLDKELK